MIPFKAKVARVRPSGWHVFVRLEGAAKDEIAAFQKKFGHLEAEPLRDGILAFVSMLRAESYRTARAYVERKIQEQGYPVA